MPGEKCKHEWKQLSHDILPSAYEQMTKKLSDWTRLEIPMVAVNFKKKLVITFMCTKCGEFKKIVETN